MLKTEILQIGSLVQKKLVILYYTTHIRREGGVLNVHMAELAFDKAMPMLFGHASKCSGIVASYSWAARYTKHAEGLRFSFSVVIEQSLHFLPALPGFFTKSRYHFLA